MEATGEGAAECGLVRMFGGVFCVFVFHRTLCGATHFGTPLVAVRLHLEVCKVSVRKLRSHLPRSLPADTDGVLHVTRHVLDQRTALAPNLHEPLALMDGDIYRTSGAAVETLRKLRDSVSLKQQPGD